MSQQIDLKIKGVYTNPNALSEVPDGALAVGDNIVIDKESVAESRRGQNFYGTQLTDLIKLFSYRGRLIVHYDTDKLAYDSDGAGTWIRYVGAYLPPDTGFKIRSAEANRNLYFTTLEGIKKLDSLTGVIKDAGAVKALNGTGAVGSTASGFMDTNTAVAYRIIWGYQDANKNLILGAPSQRCIVVNSSGSSQDTTETFLIPDDVTTSWIYQLYRSGASATATDEPNDECQLVYEGSPTSGEIAAGVVVILDQTPNDLKGAFLYTSPSQEGALKANDAPPYAKDIDVYKNHTLYANTRSKNRYKTTLISVDSPSLTYVTQNGHLVLGSKVVSAIGDTSGLRVGMRAVGTGVATGAVIVTVDSPSQVTLDKNATANETSISIDFQDGLTVAGINYYAGDTEDATTNTFLLENSLTPAENINATALSIVSVVNRSTSTSFVYAYYLSGFEDLPGQILFEERGIGGDEFSVKSTCGTSFNPILSGNKTLSGAYDDATPRIVTMADTSSLSNGMRVEWTLSGSQFSYIESVDSSTQITLVDIVGAGSGNLDFTFYPLSQESDNETHTNWIYISKPLQPEAVPITQHLEVGSADAEIKRVIALRDSTFILKEDGIYRMTGEDLTSFRITPFDTTAIVKAPESAVAFNNQVMTFSDQGIIAIADSGVSSMSRPIENILLELSAFTDFENLTFGISYDSERKYILYLPSESTDTYATQAWVYNSFTNAWTRWPLSRVAGIVNREDNKLYQAHPTNDYVYRERKSFTRDDYADEDYDVTITVVSGLTITVSDATACVVGMTLRQSTLEALITAIDGNDLTIDALIGFSTGAAKVYTPIKNTLTWVPIDGKNPGILKQFRESVFIFRDAAFSSIDALFSTNFSALSAVTTITPLASGLWGMFPWGSVPWGGVAGGAQVLRTLVPLECQRANWLNITLECEQAFSSFSLAGVSIMENFGDSRIK
jgi:hypothetical protein